MSQVIINDTLPPSRKILASQVYSATTTALLKDFAGEDITGGGWIVGMDVLIGTTSASSFATLFDGDAANDMPLLDIQPRTVMNVNVHLDPASWRRFDSTVYLASSLTSGSRVIVYYYQGT